MKGSLSLTHSLAHSLTYSITHPLALSLHAKHVVISVTAWDSCHRKKPRFKDPSHKANSVCLGTETDVTKCPPWLTRANGNTRLLVTRYLVTHSIWQHTPGSDTPQLVTLILDSTAGNTLQPVTYSSWWHTWCWWRTLADKTLVLVT